MNSGLTYCSMATPISGLGVVILVGTFDSMPAFEEAKRLGLVPLVGDYEFVAFAIPPDCDEFDAYAANIGRFIPANEARELFDGKSIREWEEGERS